MKYGELTWWFAATMIPMWFGMLVYFYIWTEQESRARWAARRSLRGW